MSNCAEARVISEVVYERDGGLTKSFFNSKYGKRESNQRFQKGGGGVLGRRPSGGRGQSSFLEGVV